MAYSKRKTFSKTFVPPSVIILGGIALKKLSEVVGIDIDSDTSMIITTSAYSTTRGFMNWLRNRKR